MNEMPKHSIFFRMFGICFLFICTKRVAVADTQGFGAGGFERWQKALRGGYYLLCAFF